MLRSIPFQCIKMMKDGVELFQMPSQYTLEFIVYVFHKCVDLETTSSEHGNWTEATNKTSSQLSRHIKELEELYLYPQALVEFTYNKSGYWS